MTMITKPLKWAFDATKVPFWRQYGASGLWLLPLWENTGTALADVGSLAAPAVFAGAAPPTWVADPLGVGVGFGGVSARADMVTPIGLGSLMANGPFTACAVIRPNTVGTYKFVVADDTAAGGTASMDLFASDANPWSSVVSAGGSAHTLTGLNTVLVAAGTLCVQVVTFDTSDASHHWMTQYLNGASNGTPFDFGASNLDNGTTLTIGRQGAKSFGYFSGTMLLLVAQRGVWIPAQIAQFSADPFQVLDNGNAGLLTTAWKDPVRLPGPQGMTGPLGMVAEARGSLGSTVLPGPEKYSHLRRERRQGRR